MVSNREAVAIHWHSVFAYLHFPKTDKRQREVLMLMEKDATRAGLEKTIKTIKARKHLDASLVELIDSVAHLQAASRQDIHVHLPAPEKLASPSEVLQGKALLELTEFPYDKLQTEKLLGQLLDVVEDLGGPLAEASRIIAKAIASGDIKTDEAYQAFLSGNTDYFEAWSTRFPEAPRTLDFLMQASITPSLEAIAHALAENLTGEGPRQTGSCPICGSLPLIASIRGKKGQRFATCSTCRHEYRIRRLACPFCDEEDHTKLTFFTAKEEPFYRVDTCKTCGLYIKTIDFREADRQELPQLDDLDSLTLDFVADREGYRRATLSAWGF